MHEYVEIEVELTEIQPRIWRRFLIPSSGTRSLPRLRISPAAMAFWPIDSIARQSRSQQTWREVMAGSRPEHVRNADRQCVVEDAQMRNAQIPRSGTGHQVLTEVRTCRPSCRVS